MFKDWWVLDFGLVYFPTEHWTEQTFEVRKQWSGPSMGMQLVIWPYSSWFRQSPCPDAAPAVNHQRCLLDRHSQNTNSNPRATAYPLWYFTALLERCARFFVRILPTRDKTWSKVTTVEYWCKQWNPLLNTAFGLSCSYQLPQNNSGNLQLNTISLCLYRKYFLIQQTVLFIAVCFFCYCEVLMIIAAALNIDKIGSLVLSARGNDAL